MGEPETSSAAVDADLMAFVRRLRARYGRGAAVRAAQQLVLAAAVPAIVLAWLVPASAATIVAVLAAAVVLAAAAAWHTARGRATRSLAWFTGFATATANAATAGGATAEGVAADDDVDPRARATLAELSDELATWLEPARPGDPAMRRWLALDVRSKLPALPERALATLGRRRLGRLLWLLPLAVLLLLAWLLSFLLSPPWTGALGGGRDEATQGDGGGGSGPGRDGGGGGTRPDDAPRDEASPPRDDTRKDPPPPAPPASPAPPEGPEPTPEPPAEPAPLLDLPTQHKFLVPEFVGDGPTRRVRMHAAEVDDGPGAAPAVNRTGGTAAERRPPPPTRETFERAAEAAQRARHVPPAERAVVTRYFEALREAAK